MLGASPDGLEGRNALLEVKCPFTQRDCTKEEAVSSDDIQKNAEGHYELKKNRSTGIKCREICSFIVWTTKETLILKIEKDSAWADNFRCLQDFYTRHVIPEFTNDLL